MISKFTGIIVAVICLVVLLCAGLFATLLLHLDGNFLDRFEVIRVASEPGSNRHAVTYWNDHSDSSNRVLGTWIVFGSPPVIGSTDPPRGAPVVVWTGAPGDLNQRWIQGRLEVSTKGRLDAVRYEPKGCYYEYDGKRVICFDSKAVDFVESYPR
jgi:hypothetical protein